MEKYRRPPHPSPLLHVFLNIPLALSNVYSYFKMAAAHGNVKVIGDDSQFRPELTNAGSKLVVVDFTASW